MRAEVKKFLIALTFIAYAALLSACGESETNPPAVPLTASSVASQTANGHTHTVSIPFIDVSASPAGSIFQYRTSDTGGHSHVIALSGRQIIDLYNGMQLIITSSAPSSGTNHTHTWNLQGGSVLYEKFCYNCHSNDKRNHTPMNVSFIASQINAVINPGGAPVSTSSAAVPDSAYTPSTTAIPLDGAALYASNCASVSCHNSLASTTKPNRTAAQIRNAINSVGSMIGLGALTDAQLQAIAAALVR